MDLVTLASNEESASFLRTLKKHPISSVYLGATINSPGVISGGDADQNWYMLYVNSENIQKARYISETYGKNTWWWTNGRPGFTIQSKASYGQTACLKMSLHTSKSTFSENDSMTNAGYSIDIFKMPRTLSKNDGNGDKNLHSSVNAESSIKSFKIPRNMDTNINDSDNSQSITNNDLFTKYSISFVDCKDTMTVVSVCQRKNIHLSQSVKEMERSNEQDSMKGKTKSSSVLEDAIPQQHLTGT